MAKRLTDVNKWDDLKVYFDNHFFKHDKWLVAKGDHITRLEEKPGCYVIYSEGELVYIGQSNSPRFRMAQHLSKARQEGMESPWGDIDSLFLKIKYPSQYGKEAMIEKRLIRRLKPSLNGYMKCNKRAYRRS